MPEAYEGPLYAEISPRTFSILARTGSRLSQIRFRAGTSLASDEIIAMLHANEALVSSGQPISTMEWRSSVDLSGADKDQPVGFRAKRHSGLIDVDKKAGLEVLDYLGADLAAGLARPRSRPVLHPRLQGSGAGAAHACRRDGSVQSAGRRIPRALRRVSSIRASAIRRAMAKGRARCSKSARTRCRSSSRTGRSSAGSSMNR